MAAVTRRPERSPNRFELKYIVHHRQVDDLLHELEPFTRPDANRERADGYPVYSVYWDSPALTFFWEKVEGLKDRRKLRVRRYVDADYGFVEIKHRTDRTLQKRRAKVPLDLLFSSFRGANDPTEAAETLNDDVVTEAVYLRHRYDLRPTMAVGYRRLALFGLHQPDLRITFDRRVQYDRFDLDIAEPFETGRYVLDPRHQVMEIKFDDHAPRWLSRLVLRHGLPVTRMSKYCTAVDHAYFDHRLT